MYLNDYNSVHFAFQSAFNFENKPTRKNFSNYMQGRYFRSPVHQLYQHLQSLKEERFSFKAPSHNSERGVEEQCHKFLTLPLHGPDWITTRFSGFISEETPLLSAD
jgi:hypothetical protein